MFYAGKCPKCEKKLSWVKVEAIDAKTDVASYKGVSYLCPSCNSVLSASLDPLAVKADIVKEVVAALRRG